MTRKEEIVDAAKEYTHNEGLKQIRGDWKSQEAINIQADNALFTNEDMINTFKAGAEWADEHPIHYNGQAMLYVLHKGVEQGKKEMLDKAIEWLRNETMGLLLQPKENYELVQEFVDCFKEAMEE